MDEVWMLVFFSLAMLIGCYVSGMIPLVVGFSEEKLQIVSVLGAGLLVGTALAVIIPEGVNTLYMVAPARHEDASVNLLASKQSAIDQKPENNPHHSHSDFPEVHSFIGISLVLGFLFMLIVDQVFGGHKTIDAEGSTVKQDRNKVTATLGLVVHAAADGVALGAAATTTHADIELIVFLAIMLHKAPAAFGLVTFLLHEGHDRAKIRKHLLIFSLAAPIFSLLTYFGISQFIVQMNSSTSFGTLMKVPCRGESRHLQINVHAALFKEESDNPNKKNKETLSAMNATGIAMLFSAGTFLYVSTVHVLPEIINRHSNNIPLSADGSPTIEQKGFKKSELCALVLGTLIPLLLTVTHHH
ncbi:Zinc transporter ZIP9 [Nymphon striatum]|nr:Zinc transporter ZIP9 [Nymphon striatum]